MGIRLVLYEHAELVLFEDTQLLQLGGEELAKLCGETKTATETLHAQAAKILDQAERLEELTKDPRLVRRYEGHKVEAKATLEQVEELRRVLEELG